MKIALDVMGGDYAPRETVQGALLALKDGEIKKMVSGTLGLVLVGRKEEIENELRKSSDVSWKQLEIVDARETISMDESPMTACRKKKDSSIVRTAVLVKEKQVRAGISAGHSGATLAAGLLVLGRIKGVSRPPIATIVPSLHGVSVLLDAGANVDCRPRHLLEFALLGEVYARVALGFKNPRVGLLSIGEEETKGNELTLSALELLRKAPIHFIGNVEGRDIVNGRCDVIVSDGFVGNVALKAIEGVGELVLQQLRRELRSNFFTFLGALLSLPAFRRFKKSIDYREYGGAPLLGINGLLMVSHGKSNAFAVKNAVRATLKCLNSDILQALLDKLKECAVLEAQNDMNGEESSHGA